MTMFDGVMDRLLIANMICICQAVYQLMDIGNDIFCTVRGLLLHSGTGLLYHTLCVQALHRLFVTVYSRKQYLQTTRFNIYMVIGQWIFSATFGLPILLTGRIIYYAGSRICQVSSEKKIDFIYIALIVFLIPLFMIIFIYIQIVMYMKRNPYSSVNHIAIAAQRRQQSELRLIRRILILVIILFMLGFPYFFFFLSIHLHLMTPWPYMPRVSYMFITFGQSISMLFNLITTDNVRKALINLLTKRHIREERVYTTE